MLVLSRTAGESICIGDQVEITVLKVRGNEVQLGVSAPPHVSIHRLEIYQRILASGEAKPLEAPRDAGA